MVDAELERKQFFPFLVGSKDYDYGFNCDLCIKSYDKSLGNEFYLNDKNYLDMLFTTYIETKTLNLHLNVKGKLLHPVCKESAKSGYDASMSVNNDVCSVPNKFLKDYHNPDFQQPKVPMFRGGPIAMSVPKTDVKVKDYTTPSVKNPAPVRNDRTRKLDLLCLYMTMTIIW